MVIQPFIKIFQKLLETDNVIKIRVPVYRIEFWTDRDIDCDRLLPIEIGTCLHHDQITKCGLIKTQLSQQELLKGLTAFYQVTVDEIEVTEITGDVQKQYWDYFGFTHECIQ